ncbi:MAG: sulfite exporter TauE/SafE family protein [Myxococcota bacterium]
MTPEIALLLVAGGAFAGFVNTLAGGGSFLTVPLLVLAGLPATDANATNRVGVLAASASALWGFKREQVGGLQHTLPMILSVLAGSWLGAYAASVVSDALFERAFGFVMLLALPLLLRNPKPEGEGHRVGWAAQLLYFAVGFYGGAIQAGIGIPLLLVLVGVAGFDLVRANHIKMALVGALTIVALAQFIWAGKVWWAYGLALAVGNSVGAQLAARWGSRVGPRLIRPVLVACVVLLAARMILGGGALAFGGSGA